MYYLLLSLSGSRSLSSVFLFVYFVVLFCDYPLFGLNCSLSCYSNTNTYNTKDFCCVISRQNSVWSCLLLSLSVNFMPNWMNAVCDNFQMFEMFINIRCRFVFVLGECWRFVFRVWMSVERLNRKLINHMLVLNVLWLMLLTCMFLLSEI